MLEVLLAFVVPTAGFGLFALLSLWLGAESRPWFDERPVLDDRPNWFPISRRLPDDDDEEDDEDVVEDDDDEPRGGTPQPVASDTRASTRPAGVWSAASSAAS